MKRLILVRHATAVDAGPQGSDFHRGLKRKGRREALLMAERVGPIVGIPDNVISSPADRALETAQAFIAQLGIPESRLQTREEFYGGLLPEDFLQVVRRLDDDHDTVMVFGHDPSFTEFAAFIIRGFKHSIPKAGVLVIEFDRPKWRSIRAGDGRAALFQRPAETDVQKRIEEDLLDRLVIAIRSGIFASIRELGIAETQDVVKSVARYSARLARELRPYAKAGSGAPARDGKKTNLKPVTPAAHGPRRAKADAAGAPARGKSPRRRP